MIEWIKNCDRKQQRIVFGLLVLTVVALLRLPWIACDGGIESFWGYGYFVTDEGYYTGDGRLAYLTGDFFSPDGESLSFYKMPIVNILVFLSYKFFGLSLWAARVPQILASLWTWWLVYHMASRRTVPWVAALMVLLASSSPPCLVYERTVSTDFIMGSFAITAFWLLGRRHGRLTGLWAGIFMALACLTKTSALGLVPLLVATSLRARQGRWLRTGLFAASAIGLVFAARAGLEAYATMKANEHGLSLNEALVLGNRVSGAPKLSLERLPSIMRALSVSPRWPVAGKISFFVLWAMGASGMILLRKVMLEPLARWKRYDVLAFGLLLYCVLVSTHIYFNVRYLLPIYCLTPLLIIECRRFWFPSGVPNPSMRIALFVALVIVAILLFWQGPLAKVVPSEVMYSQFMSPKKILWGFTWPTILLLGVAGGITAFFSAPRSRRLPIAIFGAACALWLAQLGLTVAPFLRQHLNIPSAMLSSYSSMQNLLLVSLFSLFAGWLLLSSWLKNYRVWFGSVCAIYLITFVANPLWRVAAGELLERRTNVREIAGKIVEQLPENSVVVGDRANSMFVDSSFTLIPHATPNADAFWDSIEHRMAAEPDRPVFVMLDPVQSVGWRELEARKNRFHYKMIGKLPLPSFANGQTMETYIAQLSLVKKDINEGLGK